MQNFGNCEEITDDIKIVLKEERSKITFLNNLKNDVRKIKIDDCLIKEGPRSDYLLIDNSDTYYWVELKGTDIRHAIEQLKATIIKFNVKKNQSYSFVIPTKVNPSLSTTIQINKRYFIKHFKSILIVKNTPCEIDLETKVLK